MQTPSQAAVDKSALLQMATWKGLEHIGGKGLMVGGGQGLHLHGQQEAIIHTGCQPPCVPVLRSPTLLPSCNPSPTVLSVSLINSHTGGIILRFVLGTIGTVDRHCLLPSLPNPEGS